MPDKKAVPAGLYDKEYFHLRGGEKRSEMTFLDQFLELYPGNPSQAFWRAIEAEALLSEKFASPLLDLGCGDGCFASVLFGRLGIKPAAGCDLSAVKVEKAGALGLYCEAVTADILKLPYKDGSFAAVFSNCVLEHIPDDVAALKEAARVLGPGGTFIFTVPSENFIASLPAYGKLRQKGLEDEARAYAARIDKRLEHHHYRSPGEWKDLLHRAGLNLGKTVYYLNADAERLWIRFLEAEEWAGGLPWPLDGPFRLALKAWAGIVMRAPRLWKAVEGGGGGGLMIVAVKEVK